MLATLGLAIAIVVAVFVGFTLVKAYYPSLFRAPVYRAEQEAMAAVAEAPVAPPLAEKEGFVASKPVKATKVNTPAPPVPAPAPPLQQDRPMEEREVSPGGPSAPNVRPPADTVASISPEVKPLDPYSDSNMEAPIQNSMRYPELSFGPGVDNTGLNKLALSGVGSTRATAAASPFSPEFAQNGGSFMGGVFANDLVEGDSFANA